MILNSIYICFCFTALGVVEKLWERWNFQIWEKCLTEEKWLPCTKLKTTKHLWDRFQSYSLTKLRLIWYKEKHCRETTLINLLMIIWFMFLLLGLDKRLISVLWKSKFNILLLRIFNLHATISEDWKQEASQRRVVCFKLSENWATAANKSQCFILIKTSKILNFYR